MAKTVNVEIPAKGFMDGFRAIGYSFSTAVADIIDNSISASATRIDIYSDPQGEPYFCVLDNGIGMNEERLNNAMLFGSDRSDVQDCELELGRFGLGLKTASLSQCREFIVVSKQADKIIAMALDIDLILEQNKMLLKILETEEISAVPQSAKLRELQSGTLVVWKKFDRIQAAAKNFEDSFRMSVAEAKKHVELVFHRFYDDVEIYFNELRVEKRDPFLVGSVNRQQTGRKRAVPIGDSVISITPFSLPYANKLTEEERKLLGNPKSIYDEQGFYLYRNRRLISWGSWMRMNSRSELNKLARIQVDIPSTLDSEWSLDVKKSSAKIPDKIKDILKIAIRDSITRSVRTNEAPVNIERQQQQTIWERCIDHEYKISYRINRSHLLIKSLFDTLGKQESRMLEMLLSKVEFYLPKCQIGSDINQNKDIVNGDKGIIEDEHLLEDLVSILEFVSDGDLGKVERSCDLLLMMDEYRHLSGKKEIIVKRVLGNE